MFAEDLPEVCPPAEAVDEALDDVYRLVDSKACTERQFMSHAFFNRPKPASCCDCEWASCSLTTDPESLLKLPKMRGKLAAKLALPVGSGLSLRNKKNHVHLWRYDGFDIVGAIVGWHDA